MNTFERAILDDSDPLRSNLVEEFGFLIPENLPPNADRVLYAANYIRSAVESRLFHVPHRGSEFYIAASASMKQLTPDGDLRYGGAEYASDKDLMNSRDEMILHTTRRDLLNHLSTLPRVSVVKSAYDQMQYCNSNRDVYLIKVISADAPNKLYTFDQFRELLIRENSFTNNNLLSVFELLQMRLERFCEGEQSLKQNIAELTRDLRAISTSIVEQNMAGIISN